MLSLLRARGRPSAYTPGGAFYLPVDISASGLSALDFALQLLTEKGVAVIISFNPNLPITLISHQVAPGTAFDTGPVGEAGSVENDELQRQLRSFVRLSLANSEANLITGVGKLCDLLDECSRN